MFWLIMREGLSELFKLSKHTFTDSIKRLLHSCYHTFMHPWPKMSGNIYQVGRSYNLQVKALILLTIWILFISDTDGLLKRFIFFGNFKTSKWFLTGKQMWISQVQSTTPRDYINNLFGGSPEEIARFVKILVLHIYFSLE